MMPNTLYIQSYSSPCGQLMLGSYAGQLCLCDWKVESHRRVVDSRLQRILKCTFRQEPTEIINMACRQLDEYFRHERQSFDLPLFFVGTEFQKKVWQTLLTIPYGTTVSYAYLARRIGMPRAVRAVANANGANAISIFGPCHRVIGSDGSLTGYGGGLPAKKYLLELENPQIIQDAL